MFFRMLIMIPVTLGVLLGSHYLVYYSAVQAFGISKGLLRQILLWSLLAISILAPLTFPLVRFWRNWFSLGIYWLSMGWLSLFINLLAAIIVAWGLVGIARLTGAGYDLKKIAVVVCAFTVMFTMYGVWKAQYPRIHEISVEIKNLPAYWKNSIFFS